MQRHIEAFMDQEKMHRMEGRKGYENLCKIVKAMGYKDPLQYGQLSNGAAIGDLLYFLEDNSGAIEAILNWIGEQDSPEWKENIAKELTTPIDSDDEGND